MRYQVLIFYTHINLGTFQVRCENDLEVLNHSVNKFSFCGQGNESSAYIKVGNFFFFTCYKWSKFAGLKINSANESLKVRYC